MSIHRRYLRAPVERMRHLLARPGAVKIELNLTIYYDQCAAAAAATARASRTYHCNYTIILCIDIVSIFPISYRGYDDTRYAIEDIENTHFNYSLIS